MFGNFCIISSQLKTSITIYIFIRSFFYFHIERIIQVKAYIFAELNRYSHHITLAFLTFTLDVCIVFITKLNTVLVREYMCRREQLACSVSVHYGT